MNAPYIPSGGLMSRVTRQWARVAARAPLEIDLDHAIVTFTFDDFPKSAATTGAQILDQHGWKGTYYASGAYAGSQTHHGRMFDPGDLQRLSVAGHEIGCHTYEHLDCSSQNVETIIASVERNARALKLMGLETPLQSFAYPYGEATPAAKRALGEHFSTLRGVRAEINRTQCDQHLLKSVPLDGGDIGIKRAIEAAESMPHHPGWLIYYAHDIQLNPTQWGCTPEQFRTVCDAVEKSGARVMTMSEAFAEMEQSQ
jgi:peptidoglycan/xylan/chitin deacetylase (PgdA/CDA1 family)